MFKEVLKKISIVLSLLLVVSTNFNTKVFAASNEVSDGSLRWAAPSQSIMDNMDANQRTLKGKDLTLGGIINWLITGDSYILSLHTESEKTNITYHYMNIPSIAKAITNQSFGKYFKVGYQESTGMYYKIKPSEARTADQLYGWNFPQPAYVGEEPFCTIDYNFGASINWLQTGASIVIGNIVGFFTGDTSIADDANVLENYKIADAKSIIYNTEDYPNAGLGRYTNAQLLEVILSEKDPTKIQDILRERTDKDYIDITTAPYKDRAKDTMEYMKNNTVVIQSMTGNSMQGSGIVNLDLIKNISPENEYTTKKFPTEFIAEEDEQYGSILGQPVTVKKGEIDFIKLMSASGDNIEANLVVIGSVYTRCGIGDDKLINLIFPTRIMPYSISNLSGPSRDYVAASGDIADPRALMYEEDQSLFGFPHQIMINIKNGIATNFIGITTNLMKLSADMNSMCTLSGFQNLLNNGDVNVKDGDDTDKILEFWKNPIFGTIVILLAIIVIIKILQTLLGFLRGESIRPLFPLLIISFLTILIIVAPASFIKFVENTADRVINLSTVFPNKEVNDLCADNATVDDKARVKYWLIGISAWTDYNTAHTYGSTANTYDESMTDINYYREYNNFSGKDSKNNGSGEDHIGINEYAYIGSNNKHINKWSIIMLNAMFLNLNTMYRGVDHFMAPRFKTNPDQWAEFTMVENENYGGTYIQTLSPFFILWVLLAIGILFLTIFKVLCFVEFLYDFIMLIVNGVKAILKTGSGDMSANIKETFIAMIKALGKTVFWDMMIGVLVFLSLDASYLLLAILVVAALGVPIKMIIGVVKGGNTGAFEVIMPSLLGIIIKTMQKVVFKIKDSIPMVGELGKAAEEIKEHNKKVKDNKKKRKAKINAKKDETVQKVKDINDAIQSQGLTGYIQNQAVNAKDNLISNVKSKQQKTIGRAKSAATNIKTSTKEAKNKTTSVANKTKNKVTDVANTTKEKANKIKAKIKKKK